MVIGSKSVGVREKLKVENMKYIKQVHMGYGVGTIDIKYEVPNAPTRPSSIRV
jgi:hypothetical protein